MKYFLVLAITAIYGSFPIGVCAQDTGKNDEAQVVGIKELGISAANEKMSVIEVKWKYDRTAGRAGSFNLRLVVTYADRTQISQDSSVDGTLRSARFEVPSVKNTKIRRPAYIKKVEATVTAVRLEN